MTAYDATTEITHKQMDELVEWLNNVRATDVPEDDCEQIEFKNQSLSEGELLFSYSGKSIFIIPTP